MSWRKRQRGLAALHRREPPIPPRTWCASPLGSINDFGSKGAPDTSRYRPGAYNTLCDSTPLQFLAQTVTYSCIHYEPPNLLFDCEVLSVTAIPSGLISEFIINALQKND